MARLVGILANRPDLPGRLVAAEPEVFRVTKRDDHPLAWGLGFHQSGELLLKRRPVDDRPCIDLAEMLDGVESDLVIGHVRRATVGALRAENTHPFRYRELLFANTGTVGQFADVRDDLLGALPDFLRKSVRGETDSELVFHHLLLRLHVEGQLDQPKLGAVELASALRDTLDAVESASSTVGAATSSENRLNCLVATHEHLVIARRGAPMAYLTLRGKEVLTKLFPEESLARLRMPELEACSVVAVASDFVDDVVPRGWTPIADSAMMIFRRSDAPIDIQPKG